MAQSVGRQLFERQQAAFRIVKLGAVRESVSQQGIVQIHAQSREVGGIVGVLTEALVAGNRLVDEVVVGDIGSTDRIAEVATRAGAPRRPGRRRPQLGDCALA